MLSRKFLVVGVLVCMLSVCELRPVYGAEVGSQGGFGGDEGGAPAADVAPDAAFSQSRPSGVAGSVAKKSIQSKSGSGGMMKTIMIAGIGAAAVITGIVAGVACCKVKGVGPFGGRSDAYLKFFKMPEGFDEKVGKAFESEKSSFSRFFKLGSKTDGDKRSYTLTATIPVDQVIGLKVVDAQKDVNAQAQKAGESVGKMAVPKEGEVGPIERTKNAPVIVVPAEDGKKASDVLNNVATGLADKFKSKSKIEGVQVGGAPVDITVSDVTASDGKVTVTYTLTNVIEKPNKEKDAEAIKSNAGSLKGAFAAVYDDFSSQLATVDNLTSTLFPGATGAATGVKFLTGSNDTVAAQAAANKQKMCLAQMRSSLCETFENATFEYVKGYGKNADDILKFDESNKTMLSLADLNTSAINDYKTSYNALSSVASDLGKINPMYMVAEAATEKPAAENTDATTTS